MEKPNGEWKTLTEGGKCSGDRTGLPSAAKNKVKPYYVGPHM